MTTDTRLNLIAEIESWGYIVNSQPMAGHEDQFDMWLRAVLEKIENEANALRETYGYRGKSSRLLDALHRAMPTPDWAIELK